MSESRGLKPSASRYLVALSLLVLVAVLVHQLGGRDQDGKPKPPGREPEWRPVGLIPALAPGNVGEMGEPEPTAPEVDIVVTTNVPGARVFLHLSTVGPEGMAHRREAVADADGRAEFTLGADAVHVQRITARASAPGFMDGEERVRFGRAAIDLSPGIAVPGTVRDPDGNPIAGAWVLVTETGQAFFTGPDGRITLHVPVAGRRVVQVEHPQFVGRIEEVDLDSEGVSFVLERGLTVTGCVRLESGEPVAGIPITAPTARASARTDEAGRYVLSGLPAGRIPIACDASEEQIVAEAGGVAPDFVIPGPLVRLNFRDEKGRPLCGVNFDLTAHTTGGPEEDGAEYSFDNFPESEIVRAVPEGSRIEVRASAPGFAIASFSSRAPIRADELLIVQLDLKATGPRVLQPIAVTRAAGGSPARVEVRALLPNGALVSSEVVKLDESGHGLMTRPPANANDLRVRDLASPLIEAPLRASTAGPATATLPSGATVLVVGSALPPAERLALESTTGTPLPVVFRPAATSDGLPDRLREVPVFVSLQSVPPGSYRLVGLAKGGRSSDVALTVHAGDERVVVRID